MFMANETACTPLRRSEDLIVLVRGQRVMLDSDLAKIYGVSTMRLNEQFRRNRDRFPAAFAFQLTGEEFACLISHFAISKKGRGGRRKLPWVFTGHGALQLSNVLKSETAIEASVRVVQVFVSMREQLVAHKELAGRLAESEGRVAGHDEAIQDLFEAIRRLIEPPLPENRKQIGFMRESAPPYRVRTSKAKAI